MPLRGENRKGETHSGHGVGIVECQTGWRLSVVDGQNVEHVGIDARALVNADHIGSASLTVGNDGSAPLQPARPASIGYALPMFQPLRVGHRHRTVGGQQLELLAPQQGDGHLSGTIGHGEEMGVFTNAALGWTWSMVQTQRLPLPEERRRERGAMQAVDNDAVVKRLHRGSTNTKNDHIVAGCAKHIRVRPRLRHVLHVGKVLDAVVEFHVVVVIPVAADGHTPAIDFDSVQHDPLGVQAAKALKGVSGWGIPLDRVNLPDSQVVLMATSQQYLPRRERQGQPIVMGIDHLHQMPLAVAVILSGGRRLETTGVASHHHKLSIDAEGEVVGAGIVQVGQPLGLYFQHRTGSLPPRPKRQQQPCRL